MLWVFMKQMFHNSYCSISRNRRTHFTMIRPQTLAPASTTTTTSSVTIASTNTNTMNTIPKHSGLQKQVIHLYRKLLRTSIQKDYQQLGFQNGIWKLLTFNQNRSCNNNNDEKTTAKLITQEVRFKFRRQALSVDKRDIDRIEHYIRQGEKSIKLMKMKGMSNAMSSKNIT